MLVFYFVNLFLPHRIKAVIFVGGAGENAPPPPSDQFLARLGGGLSRECGGLAPAVNMLDDSLAPLDTMGP